MGTPPVMPLIMLDAPHDTPRHVGSVSVMAGAMLEI